MRDDCWLTWNSPDVFLFTLTVSLEFYALIKYLFLLKDPFDGPLVLVGLPTQLPRISRKSRFSDEYIQGLCIIIRTKEAGY